MGRRIYISCGICSYSLFLQKTFIEKNQEVIHMAKFAITLDFKNKNEKEQKIYEVNLPSSASDGELQRAALEIAKIEDLELVKKYESIKLSFYKRI